MSIIYNDNVKKQRPTMCCTLSIMLFANNHELCYEGTILSINIITYINCSYVLTINKSIDYGYHINVALFSKI